MLNGNELLPGVQRGLAVDRKFISSLFSLKCHHHIKKEVFKKASITLQLQFQEKLSHVRNEASELKGKLRHGSGHGK